jgi:hypothetical protein
MFYSLHKIKNKICFLKERAKEKDSNINGRQLIIDLNVRVETNDKKSRSNREPSLVIQFERHYHSNFRTNLRINQSWLVATQLQKLLPTKKNFFYPI